MDQRESENGEIDISKLFFAIWEGRFLLIAIVFLALTSALVYVFVAKPVYLSKAVLLPAAEANLSGYNNYIAKLSEVSRQDGVLTISKGGVGGGVIDVKDAYATFIKSLESKTVQREFFERYYEPTMRELGASESSAQLWEQLLENLLVVTPKSNNLEQIEVSLVGNDAESVAELLDSYLQLALHTSNNELIMNLRALADMGLRIVNADIQASRAAAQSTAQLQALRLNEAIAIADRLGLKSPVDSNSLFLISSADSFSRNKFNGDNLMYLRGGDALRSELKGLEARSSNDPYIAALPKLYIEKAFLEEFDADSVDVATAVVDQSAQVPIKPFAPQKLMILVVAFVVSVFVGLLIVLARLFVRYLRGVMRA